MAITDTLGIQSFCFRGFSETKDLIKGIKDCGVDAIELCGLHIDVTDKEASLSILKEYRDAGIKVSAYGVNRFNALYTKARPVFDFAIAAGFDAISTTFDPGAVDVVSALCRETGKKAALHNHGRKDPHGSVEAIEKLLAETGPEIGLCLDTAWMIDSGEDPVEMAERFKDRLYGVHIKDFVFDRAGNVSDDIVGKGNLDLPGLAKVLTDNKFSGYLTLEYEGDVDNPVPALQECVKEIKAAF
ncbi:MAG: sugar phosphate isomerase/epimerase family protein [Planctomycetota bacterium]|jgi:sugar phosphate isomerase/epimerase